MKRKLLAAMMALALAGCGGTAETKATGDPAPALSDKKADPEPPPLPHADRKDDPTVLVPGAPPLTQGMMDRGIDVWEWVLDLRLTEPQRAQWQKLWTDGWKKADEKGKAQRLTSFRGNVAFWEGLAKLREGERDLRRLQLQAPDLAALRKSPDELDRWMASLYDEAHKPGGVRNAILVAGDPPLTQDMMDLYRTAMDYVLDIRMTDGQRDEFQKAFIDDWKKNDPKQWAKNIESWRAPLSRNQYNCRVWRAGQQPLLLDGLRKSDEATDAWLLAAYEAAHKPGSDRNPVLAAGDPALTRDVVDQYGDMVEAVLDFSASGGLTDGQRRDLEDLLVKDWKGMDRAARQDLLQSLKKWPSPPRFLAQLRAAPSGDQRSQYLLEIRNKEQEMAAEVRRLIQRSRETTIDAIRNAGPIPGHYEYNSATGRYDRFVEDR
jgi:hypothetical protein